jgi:hypothetical protein
MIVNSTPATRAGMSGLQVIGFTGVNASSMQAIDRTL